MSHWRAKSESNLKATNILDNEPFFASSVHCSYYSCIQFMYHILHSHFLKSDEEIDDESYAGSKVAGGLHNWLLNTIFAEINNRTDANTFDNLMSDLQILRVMSDYKNHSIDVNQALSAQDKAKKTIKVLSRNFKI